MGNSISTYTNIQNSNQTSTTNTYDNVSLSDSLDYIATHYILTMDFNSLRKLHEKNYCQKLVVLTSDIIDKYFNHLQVKNLAKRVKVGDQFDNNAKKNISFLKKDDIDYLNTNNDKIKKMYCNEIAKFYIKIAHIFSAILTTINPEYTYNDFLGRPVKVKLSEKSSIPEYATITVSKINLCGERIDALKGKQDFEFLKHDNEIDEKEKMNIKPEICYVHMNKNGELENLEDEPGISELIDLYYDSDYDFKTGKFLGMSIKTQQEFQDDLRKFYTTFTGNTDMPLSVKKFSDIKLKNYSKNKFCEAEFSGITYSGSYKEKLFFDYASNLKQMIQNVNKKQESLLNIINKIFTYVNDPITNNKIIKINSYLNEDSLQEIIVETRNLIIELYLKCESDFTEGVKIYQAIVESQILDTTQKHIENLEKEREKLIQPYYQIK